MEHNGASQLLKWEWASWDRLGVWLEPSAGRDKKGGKRRTDRLITSGFRAAECLSGN